MTKRNSKGTAGLAAMVLKIIGFIVVLVLALSGLGIFIWG